MTQVASSTMKADPWTRRRGCCTNCATLFDVVSQAEDGAA